MFVLGLSQCLVVGRIPAVEEVAEELVFIRSVALWKSIILALVSAFIFFRGDMNLECYSHIALTEKISLLPQFLDLSF